MSHSNELNLPRKPWPAWKIDKKGLWKRHLIRIGHGGAAGTAPANTLKSLSIAIEAGVDMVEFDVRPCLDEIVLLHDDNLSQLSGENVLASQTSLDRLRKVDAGDGEPIATLDEALELVGGKALINLDLKTVGIETQVTRKLASLGLYEDTIVSSHHKDSLIKLKELAPSLKTGLSFPKDRANVSTKPALSPLVSILLKLLQGALPYRVVSMMRNARADAVMLNLAVVSSKTVRRVHEAGGLVFAWTADNLPALKHLVSTGVDGIASNYPQLFNQLD